MGTNDKPGMNAIDLEHLLTYMNNNKMPNGSVFACGTWLEDTWKKKIREWYRQNYRLNRALDIETELVMIWDVLTSTKVIIPTGRSKLYTLAIEFIRSP